ncbi:MAG TPA: type II toxin-antitoxin system mRNA interferase toxin, RelE/StbE family [Gammaproteobacteria bacterium]|jgi:proteic killer suppression protein|nr:type II toxin-antitoxin system mRNA interferase toxin, RelE/StbE family [Gammaproteobacteria bacterium]
MIRVVEISRQALKNLKRTPLYIQEKFRAWLMAVDKIGLLETRKSPGWHDEPLHGSRQGQRSIRLNKQWRAIYVIVDNDKIKFIEVIEVTPHDY